MVPFRNCIYFDIIHSTLVLYPFPGWAVIICLLDLLYLLKVGIVSFIFLSLLPNSVEKLKINNY